MKEKVVDYWMSGKLKPYKFDTVKNTFKWLSNKSQLYRYKKQIKKRGTLQDKYKKIWNYTLLKFRNASSNKITIHDIDLRRFALEKAKDIGLMRFKACDSWILKFKSVNRIVSRKITKFITKNFEQEVNIKVKAT